MLSLNFCQVLKRFWLVVIILFFHYPVFSQDSQLLGIVDNQFVLIDNLTGTATVYKELQNIPLGVNIADLTFHSANGFYYCIKDRTASPTLVKISPQGVYEVVGQFKINGTQILTVEALAYNAVNNKLCAGVSLNGDVSTSDFYSESIVEVDPTSGECTFITEISTAKPNPDIDVMTFIDGQLYLADGAPPGANFLALYSLNLQNPGALYPICSPHLLYEGAYLPIRDFTGTSQNIFLIVERNLYKYSILNNVMTLVGPTHAIGDFNGALIQGISQLAVCESPKVNLGADAELCEGETLILDASNPGSTYHWQGGTSESGFKVTEPGIYWVDVENSCGTVRDSIAVAFNKKPEANFWENGTICTSDVISLDVAIDNGTYLWQDGSVDSVFNVSESGLYSVTVSNSCGTAMDSIEVVMLNYSNLNIPNVFSPNGDKYNEFFEIDSRLVGSCMEVFQRNGIKVYGSNNYQNNWNGGGLASGVYFWLIKDACSNEHKGWVRIIN